jgi:hypothetical protein
VRGEHPFALCLVFSWFRVGLLPLKPNHLTRRCSQPLAVVMTGFDFMKQFLMFATLAAARGGSAPSR